MRARHDTQHPGSKSTDNERQSDGPHAAEWVLIRGVELERLLVRALRVALDERKPEPEWLTTVQVAELLGVSRRSIPTLIARDELPVRRIGERTLRFERDAVVAWLQTRAERPRAHAGRHLDRLKKVKP